MEPIKKIIKNIEVYYIPTKKFKTISCSFVFHNEFKKEEFNERHILSDLLGDNMRKYPTTEKRHKYLNSLYGLEAFGICTEMGDNIVNHFVVSYPNEEYLPEDINLSEKAFVFLNEVIFNPKMHNGYITKKAVKEKVDEAKEMYDSMRQQKPVYAQYQFLKEYYKSNPDQFRVYPDFANLQNVTNITMTKTYEKMLNEDQLKIFVIGDFDHDMMDKIIENNLQLEYGERKNCNASFYPENLDLQKVNDVTEYGDVTQSRIFMGYHTDIRYFSDMHPAMSVFEAMFGGFDQSKLFLKIREEMHLSYYVQTAYYTEEQMLLVAMGTNFQDENLAISEAQKVLSELQSGNIDEDLFLLAKDYCIKSLESRSDSQTALLIQNIKSYLRFGKPYDYEYRLNLYQNVSKEQVLKASNMLTLNTIFKYTKEVK